MRAFVIINNFGMMISAGVNANKGACDKRSIWNPSSYEYERDKSCDVGEYLKYENCKCRKKLIDKLVEECTKTTVHYNDMISLKNFHSNFLKLDKKHYKGITIYYIGYITVKKN